MTQYTEPTTGYFDDVAEFTPIFEDGSYVLTVLRIEATDGQFGPGLRWIFNIANQATGERIYAPNSSDLYEFHQYSSTKVTPRTKVYPWLVAFLGRPLQVGESGAALVQAVIGKSAVAYIGVGTDDPGGRQKILSIKSAAAAPRATRPPSAPPTPTYSPQGEPIAADDDEAKLMAQLEATRKRKAAANQAKAGVSEESYRELFGNQAL